MKIEIPIHQEGGNLLYTPLFQIDFFDKFKTDYLSFQADGNLVLYTNENILPQTVKFRSSQNLLLPISLGILASAVFSPLGALYYARGLIDLYKEGEELTLEIPRNNIIYASRTHNADEKHTGKNLIIEENGNLAITDSSNTTKWETNTPLAAINPTNNENDALGQYSYSNNDEVVIDMNDQIIHKGSSLATNTYRLDFKEDGNIAFNKIIDGQDKNIFTTIGNETLNIEYFKLAKNGRIIGYDKNEKIKYAIGQGSNERTDLHSKLIMQKDDAIMIYSHNGEFLTNVSALIATKSLLSQGNFDEGYYELEYNENPIKYYNTTFEEIVLDKSNIITKREGFATKNARLVLSQNGTLKLYHKTTDTGEKLVWSNNVSDYEVDKVNFNLTSGNISANSDYGSDRVKWTNNVNDKSIARTYKYFLVLQSNGNLVEYQVNKDTSKSKIVWETHTAFLNDGNFYNSKIDLDYNSYTRYNSVGFNMDSLSFESSGLANRNTNFIAQTDGNLIVNHQGDSTPVWNSGTAGKGIKRFIFQTDGNIVGMDDNSNPVWSLTNIGARLENDMSKQPCKFYIQEDGNIVIRNNIGQPLWSTETANTNI